MRNAPGPDVVTLLIEEVARLVPEYARDPIDRDMSGGGNAAIVVIDPTGRIAGRIFGTDRARSRWVFGIANRKAIQVLSTGYATGRFEELVYAGKLDDSKFGINRPDFIGWMGGVPLLTADGQLIAAAFSGFRGEKDVEIVVRAAAVAGLKVKSD